MGSAREGLQDDRRADRRQPRLGVARRALPDRQEAQAGAGSPTPSRAARSARSSASRPSRARTRAATGTSRRSRGSSATPRSRPRSSSRRRSPRRASRPRSRASATSGSGSRTPCENIIVIRDNPRMQADTPPCIYDARRRKVARRAGLRAQAQHEPAERPAVDRRAPDELQAHPRDRPVALLLRRDALPAGDRRRARLQGPHAHHQRVRQDAGAVPRARGTTPEDQRRC